MGGMTSDVRQEGGHGIEVMVKKFRLTDVEGPCFLRLHHISFPSFPSLSKPKYKTREPFTPPTRSETSETSSQRSRYFSPFTIDERSTLHPIKGEGKRVQQQIHLYLV